MADPIHLKLHGQPTQLLAGQRGAPPVGSGKTYRDTPASTTARVLGAIKQGLNWRAAVGNEYASSNPWLYDIITHPTRTRFLEHVTLPPNALVLDIGAGWGQITLPLARDHRVVAVEPTAERLEFIWAAAQQERVLNRIYFLQASFLEVEFPPIFDCACCIGVLEWVAQFHRNDPPRAVQLRFLQNLRKALRPGGGCILGIENRLGLKYLLGARDDHTTLPLVSVFDAQLASARHRDRTGAELRVFTYSLAEYDVLFREAGFTRISAFGAFPDYKLPQLILPLADPKSFNAYLRTNPLPPEHDGVDGRPLDNQDELASHYRSLAEMEISQYFSPSFFFLLE